ncbi:MAG TPA: putative sugar nucleotidyl transferase [Ignavibacteria bacterium]|nr:putative sugar nucleotidyl transferase [Ignavibacteria bacterium]
MRYLIFEDSFAQNLFPISNLRATFDVKCGCFSALERLKLYTSNSKIDLFVRNEIQPLIQKSYPDNKVNDLQSDDYIIINGGLHLQKSDFKHLIKNIPLNYYISQNGRILFAKISKDNIKNINDNFSENNFSKHFKKFENIDINFSLLDYPWDTIKYFEDFVNNDIKLIFKNVKSLKNKSKFIQCVNPDNIYISKSVNLSPYIALDASDGFIFIDDDVSIESFVYLKGPVYIGKNSLLKSGLKVYGPSYIGENCKIAGELGEVIFHSFVNKQHEGFVGHSYICPFVNLGADTVTSDLKNNYSKLKLKFNGELVDTQMQFIGSVLGDHTKTGINTMLNTGTVAGIFSNIFGGGFPSKNIPPFSWYDASSKPELYDIEKAISTAKTVMARRKIEMTSEYENLVKFYFAKLTTIEV